MMSQTNILEYTRQASKTQHIQTHIWYKTKHAKGQVTYNKYDELKYKLPQGGTLDIRQKLDNPNDLA